MQIIVHIGIQMHSKCHKHENYFISIAPGLYSINYDLATINN